MQKYLKWLGLAGALVFVIGIAYYDVVGIRYFIGRLSAAPVVDEELVVDHMNLDYTSGIMNVGNDMYLTYASGDSIITEIEPFGVVTAINRDGGRVMNFTVVSYRLQNTTWVFSLDDLGLLIQWKGEQMVDVLRKRGDHGRKSVRDRGAGDDGRRDVQDQ